MTHDRLSDYQIAESFGDTLSLIYKAKIEELNQDLMSVYSHLDRLDIPQVPEFHRWFARHSLPTWAEDKFRAIEHINKIRNIYRKLKKEDANGDKRLDISRARDVLLSDIYAFTYRGKNVSCPFHGKDSHPSASIKYNRFVCFTCGLKLDSIGFFQRINNVKFVESVEYLNKL